MHERVHNEALSEKRGSVITARGVAIHSGSMGLSGQCDAVEFHRDPSGVTLAGREGRWLPFPVEYKRGEPKEDNCDAAQLCALAMCLEEMLCCEIADGALFYGQTRRRVAVIFTDVLRREVADAAAEMHALFRRGYTPKVKPTKGCSACSLKELCLPALMKKRSVADYMEEYR